MRLTAISILVYPDKKRLHQCRFTRTTSQGRPRHDLLQDIRSRRDSELVESGAWWGSHYCDQMGNKARDITCGTRQVVNPSENGKQRYSARNENIHA